MRDSSINLADGTPVTGIVVSYDDFDSWASGREFDPDAPGYMEIYFRDKGVSPYVQQRLFSIKSEAEPRNIDKHQGGRPPVYNWPPVLISFLVDALYRDTKIDSQSSTAQIAEAIQEAFGDPQFAPGTTLAKEYASKIKNALMEKDKARQSQTGFRP